MEQGISGSLEGFDELLKVLNTLGDEKEVNKLLKKANKEAVKPLQKAFSGLPFPPHLTKAAIRAVKVEGNRHPNAVAVGPTSDQFKIRFLNTGTVDRYTKAGAYRGKIVGKKVIAPFVEAKAREVQINAETQYGEDLVKLTARDVKRINKNK